MNVDLAAIALPLYGVKEVPGSGDSGFIMSMAKECAFTDYVHDSIAWCSLAANWIALKAGYERSKALNARSWLTIGTALTVPDLFDIVVLWRDDPKGALGHVGFYVASNNGLIYLFAGNQGDQFCVEGFDKKRILGFRRLSKV